MKTEAERLLSEERQSLWALTYAPVIWALHFVFSYSAAAIWCGVIAGREAGAGMVRGLIAGAALIALGGIALTARWGWRRFTHGSNVPQFADDTEEDRHRFLGFATVLLSGLSAVATIYVALSTFFMADCW